MQNRIAVIGAGEVGIGLIRFLDQLQNLGQLSCRIELTLIEANESEQCGAKTSCNINHETGYEYFRIDDHLTGRQCIEGAVTKRLLFPAGFHNHLCPARFMVSTDSDRNGDVPYREFQRNAHQLRAYYGQIYESIRNTCSWSDERTRKQLGHDIDGFGRELQKDDFSDLAEVIGGYHAAGGTVNMAMDYALKRAALDRAEGRGTLLRRMSNTIVTDIRQLRNGSRVIRTNKGEIPADYVVCTASHGIPTLGALVGGVGPVGTYLLNCMLYVKLPPTSDAEIQRTVSQVTFVLQGDHGCMFACVYPPSSTSAGIAAIYFPSREGSQIDSWVSQPNVGIPNEFRNWSDWIKNGIVIDQERRQSRILEQACRFNPILRSYCPQPMCMTVGAVFNPAGPANPAGCDLRIRHLVAPTRLSDDGRVISMTSPKWTTGELASLTLLQHLLKLIGESPLPTQDDGFGPERLDICRIQDDLHFRDVKFARRYALEYAQMMGFPETIVPETHDTFQVG